MANLSMELFKIDFGKKRKGVFFNSILGKIDLFYFQFLKIYPIPLQCDPGSSLV